MLKFVLVQSTNVDMKTEIKLSATKKYFSLIFPASPEKKNQLRVDAVTVFCHFQLQRRALQQILVFVSCSGFPNELNAKMLEQNECTPASNARWHFRVTYNYCITLCKLWTCSVTMLWLKRLSALAHRNRLVSLSFALCPYKFENLVVVDINEMFSWHLALRVSVVRCLLCVLDARWTKRNKMKLSHNAHIT